MIKAILAAACVLITGSGYMEPGSRGAAITAPGVQAAAQAPRYSHIFVIFEENKNYAQVLDGGFAPNLARLAHDYGSATQFFAEVHPSEANYVALLGGDTFGIADDDAYYCKPGMKDRFCAHADAPGYPDHTVHAPHLGQQLEAVGLSWKGYYDDIPAPGSLAVEAGRLVSEGRSYPAKLYASKHSGFMNFAAVQNDPRRAEHIVGFDQLDQDLANNQLPNFALIIPNQCDEMHGLSGPGTPPDCQSLNIEGLIRRGDRVIGELVGRLQRSAAWNSPENVAIVITFDEGAGRRREGCCGVTPGASSNFGGGHIPTVVITNHGPRGLADPTPYSHYSLLRTIEDVFGIPQHLARAADDQDGVRPMTPLFRTGASSSAS